jgi:LuxR family maltose regulon positive regulatory protein
MVLLEEVVTLLDGDLTDEARAVATHLSPESAERVLSDARIELTLARPQAALTVLGQRGRPTAGGLLVAVRLALARAEALHALSRRRDAVDQLADALDLARPAGIRRPFAEAAPWVRSWLDTRGPAARYAWVGAVGAGGADASDPQAPPSTDEAPALVTEPLTERELEVLRLVAEPMTSREVAEVLHLSLHTVKTHLRSILRKLSASSRHQAVRRARRLGLI